MIQLMMTKSQILASLGLGYWVRIAGLFGAAGIVLGAYGAHGLLQKKDVPQDRKTAFETANRYHLIHTLAILAVPFSGYPTIVGTLLIGGMTLFCGAVYAYAITGSNSVRKFAPKGGLMLIGAWLAMILS